MTNDRRTVARIRSPLCWLGAGAAAAFCTHAAFVMAVLIGAAGPGPAALAQSGTNQTAFAADLLFTGPSSPDFRGGVGFGVNLLVTFVQRAQQAQPPGSQCPTDVDFTVMAGPHPEGSLFGQALAQARRDAIAAVLRGFGPSVRVTPNEVATGLANMVFISAQAAKDKEPPKLQTTSTPPKGTKVKRGDQIAVSMVARDDANLWQTGIKTVQLVADSEGGRFLASENFPPAPPGCTALPPPRRVQGSYTVPRNPPPVVRLTALTEDHVGLMDTDVGLFPTVGDWYGTITATLKGNAYNDTAIIDYAVSEAPDGPVTGRARAVLISRANTAGVCTYTRTITPDTFDVDIVGSREGDNLRLDLSTEGRSTWVFTTQCTRGGGSGTGPPAVQPRNALASFFAIVPHIRVRARDGATNEITPITHGEITSGATITIHKARD